MLQENVATGLLLLTGIFYGSLSMGFAALLATCCGAMTASLLKYDKKEIEKGLYGFSAALVGVALLLFLKPVFLSWIFVIMGSVLASIIQHFFIVRKIPVFTFPFVLVTWVILFFIRFFYPGMLAEIPVETNAIENDLLFVARAFGQIIFQSDVLSGFLFFIAVFISSPVAALYGVAGACIAALFSFLFSMPIADIRLGLFSYNAVLCAIVFAGNKIQDGIWILVSVILSTLISVLMFTFNLTQLTFPFVAACVITLIVKKRIKFE